MDKIIWKSFELGTLFDRSTENALGVSQKELDIYEDKDEYNNVALISASRTGSGRVGYIHLDKNDINKVSINKLTFDDQWGFVYFQNENFIITGGHNSILEVKDEKLRKKIESNLGSYAFLAKSINKITLKSEIFGYGYKINNKLDREIILLPCLEMKEKDEFIWEENGKFYTLAVEYINKLMDKAKELKEQKTIRLYEKEKAKYEKEKAKYEKEYIKEKKNVVWKGFELGSIFERSTKNALGENQKSLDIYEEKDSINNIALISASRTGSGRVGYICIDENNKSKVSKHKLTFDDQWGFVYFQNEDFIITGGHNSILELKNQLLGYVLDNNIYCYYFFATSVNKITLKSEIFGYGYKINNKLDRELVLLPCLELNENNDYIFDDNNKHFTLATNYISYLYLQGRCNYYQKLIDKYTYQY